jgi:ATP-binding cassette, subfamily F, member 3
MLSVSSVSKSFAARTLFEDVSFHVNRGEKIGLVGPNGAGKTTLFSLLLGEITPDSGLVQFQKGTVLGFLPQESAPVGDESVLELALSHISEVARWEMEPQAKRILRGLAFRERDFDRPARTLSGGWVMRAHLARLLVQEPDLLMLDEPTNHLDLDSLLWFQNYLRSYPGAILMISHDREFLNQLTGSIMEIARNRLTRYTGNYDAYLREKAAREEQLQSAYDNQQREIAKMQAWVDRFKAKNTFASRAQDKMKMIDRIEKIEAPVAAEKKVKFSFPQPEKSGQRVISLRGVEFGYPVAEDGSGPAAPIYENLDFEIERGQRMVFVGPNGAGKSTLLKLLAGVLTPQAGQRDLGLRVTPGYFSQYRADTLDMRHSVMQSAMDLPTRPGEQLARNLLGSFLFRGDDVFKSVAVLSGGEKSRLALVRLLLNPPNLLLMDEPTTHLDMGSIDALIGALEAYEGTLVFISHDVHFIRQMARTVIHIDTGRLTTYPGDYQYYLDKTRAQSERAAITQSNSFSAPTNSSSAATGSKSKEQRRAEAEQRNARSRAKRDQEQKVAALEAEVARCEARREEIYVLLDDPATYAAGTTAVDLSRELNELDEKIPRLTTDWESAASTLETMAT